MQHDVFKYSLKYSHEIVIEFL